MRKRVRIFPEQLFQIVVDNDTQRRQVLGERKTRFTPSQRVWIEPIFNGIGFVLGTAVNTLPWPLIGRLHRWFCEKLEAHPPEDNPQLAVRTQEAVSLAGKLFGETGQWPVVFVGTSHPETLGPNAWLRFELLRQGLLLSAALIDASPADKPRHPPQCFLAIDPFALDTVPVPVQGLYAGFMHAQYLVWDRQASTQSWIQRHLLLRGTGHDRVGWRVLQALRRNPVLMAISGGLPFNARIFYAAREFMALLPLPAGQSVRRREAQQRLMTLLKEPVNGRLPAEEGVLFPETVQRVMDILKELGLSEQEAQGACARLQADFARATPARERLWHVLMGRFVKKGIPVLFIPLAHRENAPHVQIGEPFGVSSVPENLNEWVDRVAQQYGVIN